LRTTGTIVATRRESLMAATSKQVKGKANKVAGSAKKAVGKATKDRSLQAKGSAQKAKGTVQDAAGTVERKLRRPAKSWGDASVHGAGDEDDRPCRRWI